jgi:DNA mismatch repair protein MSH4
VALSRSSRVTFFQAVQTKRSIACSTAELMSLSDRAQEAIETALSLTVNILQTLLDQVRTLCEDIFVFVDCIALLDMLSSFAELVAGSHAVYCRPVPQASGPLVIKSGRHPLLADMKAYRTPFVANDTFMSEGDFLVVSGSNGAGE